MSTSKLASASGTNVAPLSSAVTSHQKATWEDVSGQQPPQDEAYLMYASERGRVLGSTPITSPQESSGVEYPSPAVNPDHYSSPRKENSTEFNWVSLSKGPRTGKRLDGKKSMQDIDSSKSSQPLTDGEPSAAVDSWTGLVRSVSPVWPHCRVTFRVELRLIINGLPYEKLVEIHLLVARALRPIVSLMPTARILYQRGILTDDYIPDYPYPPEIFTVFDDPDIEASGGGVAALRITTAVLEVKQFPIVVPVMMNLLRDSFNISFNKTTGLHLHVGIGSPFTVKNLKRLAKGVILLEQRFNVYHPPAQNPGYTLSGAHILPVRGNKILDGLATRNMMRMVDRAQTRQQLYRTVNPVPDFVHTGHPTEQYWAGYRYNFTTSALGTIEFRQAAGTLNGRAVVGWMGRVQVFVEQALKTREEAWMRYAKEELGKEEKEKMLEWFGMGPRARGFEKELKEVEGLMVGLRVGEEERVKLM